jgi:hypothetical protein
MLGHRPRRFSHLLLIDKVEDVKVPFDITGDAIFGICCGIRTIGIEAPHGVGPFQRVQHEQVSRCLRQRLVKLAAV